MANTTIEASDRAVLDPERTLCTCRKSVLMPAHPTVHCPKCHATYTARTLHYPVECSRCGFRLITWRRRNAIPEIQPPLP
jgi:DNA-directed RNA polymerase subunit RPC12/RpoP